MTFWIFGYEARYFNLLCGKDVYGEDVREFMFALGDLVKDRIVLESEISS
jgi:hypothetical protein